ncbi:hypothetical protein [Paludisphaera mucosa]|uniref:Uncharacterized protein n=1 Tax=Paludisphaera mucosa TaxID=3030827 RepID=A0ABT6FGY5_9BACT|nr:hypothetical protein [Paludisphaera mucosa]MDG3006834.1 hypothetical protein [Paludisphaera mucosa]
MRRNLLNLAAVAACAAALFFVGRFLARRESFRALSAHHAENIRLELERERRLRDAIEAALASAPDDRDASKAATDRLFETMRSTVAEKSREVDRWRDAPESPERRAVAVKWARTAAAEAAYMAELDRRWLLDCAWGLLPHHVTLGEVPTFVMPRGWTEADRKPN